MIVRLKKVALKAHVSQLAATILVAMIVTPANGHGDLHALISRLDEKIARNPSDADKRLERAMLHCQHESYPKALADLKEVEKLAPERPERYYVAARVHMGQEKWALAKSAFDRHLSALPRDSQSYFLRSQVQFKLGKRREAETDLVQAIKFHPKAPLSYYRALIQVQKKQDEVDKAIETGHLARKAWGDPPNILMLQARLLRDAGRPEEASQIYREIRAKTPSLTFSICLEEAGMWEATDFRKALDLLNQAEAAWNTFSQRKRERAPMQQLHRELITKKQHLSKS